MIGDESDDAEAGCDAVPFNLLNISRLVSSHVLFDVFSGNLLAWEKEFSFTEFRACVSQRYKLSVAVVN